MNNRERANAYPRYVGLALKGELATRGFTAQQVATALDRSASALNRWLNGKADIPLVVLVQVAEYIGVEPHIVASRAYDRLCDELGEPDRFPNNVTQFPQAFEGERYAANDDQHTDDLPQPES